MITSLIPSTIPARITRGETVTWSTGLNSYPAADGWAMTTYFRAAEGPGVDVVATAEGSTYNSTLTAAQSQTLAAGRCDYQTWVSRGTGPTLEQNLIANGQVEILIGFTDIDTNTPVDGRSQAEQELAALREAISRAAISGTAEYQIANRAKKRYSLEELLEYEKRLVERVNAERRQAARANGAGFFKNHAVRPTEPGP